MRWKQPKGGSRKQRHPKRSPREGILVKEPSKGMRKQTHPQRRTREEGHGNSKSHLES